MRESAVRQGQNFGRKTDQASTGLWKSNQKRHQTQGCLSPGTRVCALCAPPDRRYLPPPTVWGGIYHARAEIHPVAGGGRGGRQTPPKPSPENPKSAKPGWTPFLGVPRMNPQHFLPQGKQVGQNSRHPSGASQPSS